MILTKKLISIIRGHILSNTPLQFLIDGDTTQFFFFSIPMAVRASIHEYVANNLSAKLYNDISKLKLDSQELILYNSNELNAISLFLFSHTPHSFFSKHCLVINDKPEIYPDLITTRKIDISPSQLSQLVEVDFDFKQIEMV